MNLIVEWINPNIFLGKVLILFMMYNCLYFYNDVQYTNSDWRNRIRMYNSIQNALFSE